MDCVCERSAWFFAKRKSLGCSCRRHGRGCSPKLAFGLCYGGEGGYHPSVVERIAGKRLCRSWELELRGAEADGAKADGAKADGAKADGAKADGAKADGAEADGAKADGAEADDVSL